MSMAASISGVITDSNGQPLANVSITLKEKSGESWYYSEFTSTEDDGTYQFPNLFINDYRVEVHYAEGYVTEYYNNVTVENDASIIKVESNSDVLSDIDFSLDSAGKITGTIRDTNGLPISFFFISIFKYDNTQNTWLVADNANVYSDGIYKFENLQPGKYRIRYGDFDFGNIASNSVDVEYFNNAQSLETSSDIEIVPNDEKVIDVVLGDIVRGSISGKVSNNANIGIENVNVLLDIKESGRWTYAGRTTTTIDGSYSFSSLLANEYRIKADAHMYPSGYLAEYYNDADLIEDANTVIVGVGENLQDINFQLDRLGQIKGTVKDSNGNPLLGVRIVLSSQIEGSSFWYQENTVFTDNNGNYSSSIFDNKLYRLQFIDEQNNFYEFNNDVSSFEEATQISVAHNHEIIVDAVLGNIIFGSISGYVADSANNPIVNGQVRLYSLNADGYWETTRYTYTDINGQYTFNRLMEKEYHLYAQSDFAFKSEYYDDAITIESATNVEVGSGEDKENINFQLDKYGHIKGSIQNEEGQLISSSVSVWLYKKIGGTWSRELQAYSYNGNYEFERVLPGTYRLKFNSVEKYEYYNDVAVFEDATDIEINFNEDDKVIDITLGNITLGTLKGLVTDSNDMPIEGALLSLYSKNNNNWSSIGTYVTDVNGNYIFNYLEANNYLIDVFSYDHVSEFYNNIPYSNYNFSNKQNEAESISVVSGVINPDINFTLGKLGVISGIARDKNGQILQQGRVTAYLKVEEEWQYASSAYLDNNGHYSLTSLMPGTYRIEFYNYFENITEYSNGSSTVEGAVDIVISSDTDLIISYQFSNPFNQVLTRADIAKPLMQAIMEVGSNPPTSSGEIYTDVSSNDFNAEWIEMLSADEITEGCAETKFCPEMVITNVQLAKLLLKAKLGKNYVPPKPSGDVFSDISMKSFSAAWIESLWSHGITEGCGNNKFCPNSAVTHETFETMLSKAFP